MNKTIGVFAHVDSGKTTFCESLLYLTNQLTKPGRVDHQNSVMDFEDLEKQRKITIFSGLANFKYQDNTYYLIDTPGHVDFSAEMERSLLVIDGAILIINGVDSVQGHTLTLYNLLKEKKIPIYFFINKTDQIGANINNCLTDIKNKLTNNIFYFQDTNYLDPLFLEWLSNFDDDILMSVLENTVTLSFIKQKIKQLINLNIINLVFSGSAIKQTGINKLMDVIDDTLICQLINDDFSGRIFKVIYDHKKQKITFIKCLSGKIKVKDEIIYNDQTLNKEKINEIRIYQGANYTNINEAIAGQIIAVTGLNESISGMGIGSCKNIIEPKLKPSLKAAVILNDHPFSIVYEALKRLEQQDPLLAVFYESKIKQLDVCVMGKIQLEILKDLLLQKENLNIDFGECQVVYKETIAKTIIGYGHFEPLRHYAEVHLKIEPIKKDKIEFISECHVDNLPQQYQNLIKHYALTKDHKGILTGSFLTGVRLILINAAFHLEHTDGGDFKEATFRAIRQGLEKAENILLEPYYQFKIEVDLEFMGRVLSDIEKNHGSFEPPIINNDNVSITGFGPIVNFINYSSDLLSFTKGKGSISMSFYDYRPCHNSDTVIEKIKYEKDRDLDNPSSSIFCAKGAGFEVKWYDAESYMHLLKK